MSVPETRWYVEKVMGEDRLRLSSVSVTITSKLVIAERYVDVSLNRRWPHDRCPLSLTKEAALLRYKEDAEWRLRKAKERVVAVERDLLEFTKLTLSLAEKEL